MTAATTDLHPQALTPARVLYEIMGRPESPKPAEPADGQCYWCALPLVDGVGVPAAQVCGTGFSDHQDAQAPTMTHVCVPCTCVMSGRPPETYRMWSTVWREDWWRGDSAPEDHPKAHESLRARGLLLHNKADLTHHLETLLEPSGGRWWVSLADTGQIHTLPYASLNRGAGPWVIRYERETIQSSPERFGQLLHHVATLYVAGFSRDDIESGQPSPARVGKLGVALWRAHDRIIQPHRGSALLGLAASFLRREGTDAIAERTAHWAAPAVRRGARGEGRRDDPRVPTRHEQRQDLTEDVVGPPADSAGDGGGGVGDAATDGRDDGAQAPDRRRAPDRPRQLALFG